MYRRILISSNQVLTVLLMMKKRQSVMQLSQLKKKIPFPKTPTPSLPTPPKKQTDQILKQQMNQFLMQ